MNVLFKSYMSYKDHYECTLLMFCASFKYHHFVKYLINKKMNLNDDYDNGMSALTWAALSGGTESVELLLKASASVNETDWLGRTALHHAIRSRHGPVCRMLIEAGAEVKTPEQLDGAIEWAQANGFDNILHLLQALQDKVPVGSKWKIRREKNRKRPLPCFKSEEEENLEPLRKKQDVLEVKSNAKPLKNEAVEHAENTAIEASEIKQVIHDVGPAPMQMENKQLVHDIGDIGPVAT